MAPTRILTRLALWAAILAAVAAVPAEDIRADAGPEPYAAKRRSMVQVIELHVARTRNYLGRSKLAPRVLEALGKVPRHEFVPDDLDWAAYADQPLPIGNDQTISQPYIVAVMTDLMDLPEGCRVLEVGTGSGYQAAILAEICKSVYTIEIVEPLGLQARDTLQRLGYENVSVRIGDGFHGWPEQAPFDGIIVTAVADDAPPPLPAQLKPGGRMIIPLRTGPGAQELVLMEKDSDGAIKKRTILPVRFVPLTGDHG